MDMDVVCIKPLDELLYRYSFYASVEPPTLFFKIPLVNIGMIGASTNNMIIRRELESFIKYFKDKTY
jgi:hypothetical protein